MSLSKAEVTCYFTPPGPHACRSSAPVAGPTVAAGSSNFTGAGASRESFQLRVVGGFETPKGSGDRLRLLLLWKVLGIDLCLTFGEPPEASFQGGKLSSLIGRRRFLYKENIRGDMTQGQQCHIMPSLFSV